MADLLTTDLANTDLLQALKGESLSFVFSLDGTLISASAALQCGFKKEKKSGHLNKKKPEKQSEKFSALSREGLL